MTINQDTSLIKIVHTETYKGLKISASITRFGGFYVCVQNADNEFVTDVNNILDARLIIDGYVERKAERNLVA